MLVLVQEGLEEAREDKAMPLKIRMHPFVCVVVGLCAKSQQRRGLIKADPSTLALNQCKLYPDPLEYFSFCSFIVQMHVLDHITLHAHTHRAHTHDL